MSSRPFFGTSSGKSLRTPAPVERVIPQNKPRLTSCQFSVESQGRTLEQLEWVYNQPKPVKASLKVEKVVVQADGKVTEKIVGDAQSA